MSATKSSRIKLVFVDIRSAHNVGAILRSCDGFGADACLVGLTPRPIHEGDTRLPYIAKKNHTAIAKTALGAETSVHIEYYETLQACVHELANEGWDIIGLEQTSGSIALNQLKRSEKMALLLGREVEGLSPDELAFCSRVYEIPMLGSKESLNVAIAASIGLYQMRIAE